MVIHGLEFPFVIEGEEIGAVGNFGTVKYLVTNDNTRATFTCHIHESVIIFSVVHLLAPAVVYG